MTSIDRNGINTRLISALNDPKPLFDPDATMNRLFSLRHEFPDAWSQLVNIAGGPTRTCTLQLSKQHFPSFLDYAWQTSVDGTVTKSITLDVTKLTGYLSPHGAMPVDDVGIELNEQQPETDTELGMPAFNLPIAPGGLSIVNTAVVEFALTVKGTLRAEDWNDLYLLMDYDVGT